jgi:thiol-disulfide isomerase/thioredoxin
MDIIKQFIFFVISLFLFANIAFGADVTYQEFNQKLELNLDNLYLESGQIVDISKYRGSNLVVNIWATWCPACVKELPDLDQMAFKLKPKNTVLILISQDDLGIKVAKDYLDKLNIKNVIRLYDPDNNATKQLGVRGLPTTLLINAEGVLLGRYEGMAKWSSEEVLNDVYKKFNIN